VLLIAAALRLWRLEDNGFGTAYYAAGVRSMMQSGWLFFYNAFDPAGFISLDKPPVAFWIQTVFAWLLGYGGWTIHLPQALAGVASVALLYRLVRWPFGVPAAICAALLLALMPIAVAVDRSNNTDSWLVLFLLLAAATALRGRGLSLVLSMALLGVAFNVKMLAALVCGPALLAGWLIASPLDWRRRFAWMAASGLTLAVVSLAWAGAFDLTPKASRPYAGSSYENSMLELVVIHNGLERFVRPARPAPSTTAPAAPRFELHDSVPVGPLRLADANLAAQFAWTLPLAVLGALLGWRRRAAPIALWGTWALAYGIVFSAAGGLFHAYYLAVMAPALAALAGIGAAALWSFYRRAGMTALLLPAAVIATVLWQADILDGYGTAQLGFDHLWIAAGFLVAAAVLAIALAMFRNNVARWLAIAAAAMLLALPAAWSFGTAAAKGNTGFPAARPPFLSEAATTQRQRWAMVAGALAGDSRLVTFLRERNRGEEFLLATVNARLAAPLIIATGQPVIALGGFNGADPILTIDDFASLVAARRVRFALIGDGAPGLRFVFGEGHQKELVDWIRANGRPVDPTLWRDADTSMSGWTRRGAEAVGVQLYDLRPENGG